MKLFNHRIKTVPDRRSLSATGSKIFPRLVCQSIFLAKKPSKASVIAAITKIIIPV